MKKMSCLLLALAVVFALAACGAEPAPDPTEPSTIPATAPEATIPDVTVENPAVYISLSISYEDGTYAFLSAYDDGAGMACLEYQGDVKKVAAFDLKVLHAITAELENCGLAALDGENVTGDGFDSASMYVAFGDDTYWGAGYNGSISDEFLAGYEQMDAFFRNLMADVPMYVPQPVVMGEVDADILQEMTMVLENSGLEPLDMFCITSDVYSAAVSGAEGIAAMADCGPMMSTSAYSFTIVELEDPALIGGIREKFAANLDWNRWVCVSAQNALIAQKGNMVVCVMGGNQLYTMTARAIEAAGWTDIETYQNTGR